MKLDKYDIAITNATAKDDHRKVLQQVFLNNGNLVAADGYILVMRPAEMNHTEMKDNISGLIPGPILKNIRTTPNHQAEISINNSKIEVSYTDKIGREIEYSPRTTFDKFEGTFPNYHQLIPKSQDKKAYIAMNVKILKRVLATMPDNGIIRLGVNEPTDPIEFECSSMDRPIRGLAMPMFVDWSNFKWWRPESEASK